MKLKILIILGVLLLVGASCRDGHDGSLQKEAYGLAVYSPDEKTLTIQDELDTTEVQKTYPTDYATFGIDDEKIDWSKKVNVYFYGNSLEMVVSHIDLDRAKYYNQTAFRLGIRAFWHSLWPYLMIVATLILFLAYGLFWVRAIRLDRWGFYAARGFEMGLIVLFAVGLLNDSWLGKSAKPVPLEKAEISASESVYCLGSDGLLTLPASYVPEEMSLYRQSGDVVAVGTVLTDGERGFFRSFYDEGRQQMFSLFWSGLCILLALGMMLVAKRMQQQMIQMLAIFNLLDKQPQLLKRFKELALGTEENLQQRDVFTSEKMNVLLSCLALEAYDTMQRENPEELRKLEYEYALRGYDLKAEIAKLRATLDDSSNVGSADTDGESAVSGGTNSDLTNNANGNSIGGKSEVIGGSADNAKGGA